MPTPQPAEPNKLTQGAALGLAAGCRRGAHILHAACPAGGLAAAAAAARLRLRLRLLLLFLLLHQAVLLRPLGVSACQQGGRCVCRVGAGSPVQCEVLQVEWHGGGHNGAVAALCKPEGAQVVAMGGNCRNDSWACGRMLWLRQVSWQAPCTTCWNRRRMALTAGEPVAGGGVQQQQVGRGCRKGRAEVARRQRLCSLQLSTLAAPKLGSTTMPVKQASTPLQPAACHPSSPPTHPSAPPASPGPGPASGGTAAAAWTARPAVRGACEQAEELFGCVEAEQHDNGPGKDPDRLHLSAHQAASTYLHICGRLQHQGTHVVQPLQQLPVVLLRHRLQLPKLGCCCKGLGHRGGRQGGDAALQDAARHGLGACSSKPGNSRWQGWLNWYVGAAACGAMLARPSQLPGLRCTARKPECCPCLRHLQFPTSPSPAHRKSSTSSSVSGRRQGPCGCTQDSGPGAAAAVET